MYGVSKLISDTYYGHGNIPLIVEETGFGLQVQCCFPTVVLLHKASLTQQTSTFLIAT